MLFFRVAPPSQSRDKSGENDTSNPGEVAIWLILPSLPFSFSWPLPFSYIRGIIQTRSNCKFFGKPNSILLIFFFNLRNDIQKQNTETYVKGKPQSPRINQNNICRIFDLSKSYYIKYICHWNIINISLVIALWLLKFPSICNVTRNWRLKGNLIRSWHHVKDFLTLLG